MCLFDYLGAVGMDATPFHTLIMRTDGMWGWREGWGKGGRKEGNMGLYVHRNH